MRGTFFRTLSSAPRGFWGLGRGLWPSAKHRVSFGTHTSRGVELGRRVWVAGTLGETRYGVHASTWPLSVSSKSLLRASVRRPWRSCGDPFPQRGEIVSWSRRMRDPGSPGDREGLGMVCSCRISVLRSEFVAGAYRRSLTVSLGARRWRIPLFSSLGYGGSVNSRVVASVVRRDWSGQLTLPHKRRVT